MRALGLLLALACLVEVGCGGTTTSDDEAAEPTTRGTTAPAPTTGSSDRPPAPAIAGETLDGEQISLADLRGRPVFVNVWSSW